MAKPTLKDDWTNATLAEDVVADFYNTVADSIHELYDLHGETAGTLATIYANGTSSADSTIEVDATAEGVVIRDAATPLAGGPFQVTNNAGSSLMLKCADTGCVANFPWTFTGELSSPGSGSLSTKMGTGANALGANSTAVGRVAQATQDDSTSLGYDAQATGTGGSSAIGNASRADGAAATALGQAADAGGDASTAVGNSADAGGTSSTAVGNSASSAGSSSVALGVNANAQAANSLAIGNLAATPGENSVAVGRAATAGTTLGDGNDEATALGYLTSATKVGSTALGQAATATSDKATAVGQSADASADEALAAGYGSSASADSAVALGAGATASASSTAALGDGATAAHANSVALGPGSATTAVDQVVLGSGSTAEVLLPGAAVQVSGTLTTDGAVQVGDGSTGAALSAKGAGATIALENPGPFPILSLSNTTGADTNGARATFLAFYGQTLAAVGHTLAYISPSHSGSGNDQRGNLDFHVNTGAEGSFPSRACRMDFLGNVHASAELRADGELRVGIGGGGGELLTDTSEVSASTTRTLTMPDADVHLGDGLIAVQFGRNAPPANATSDLYVGTAGLEFVLPWDAELVAMSAASSVAQTVAGAGVVTAYKNAVSTGDSVTIESADEYPYATGMSTSFSAGDIVQCQIATHLSWQPGARTTGTLFFRVRHR